MRGQGQKPWPRDFKGIGAENTLVLTAIHVSEMTQCCLDHGNEKT